MLPISAYLPQIKKHLATTNQLVVQAEPGAGKSTLLPISLLTAEWLAGKKILMLEPRRVAAKSIAHYLAKQLGESVGQRIGYQIRNDNKSSINTILEIVTEGILTRRLQSDPELADVGLIIFDEFHERSIHADLSLLLSLEVQQTIREDLKLLVMSATIDTQAISRYMGGAAIVECPGRAFPVSVDYKPITKNRRGGTELLSEKVVSGLRQVLSAEKQGDTLVFLPGQSDIRRCLFAAEEAFASNSTIVFLPLYGGLSLEQQERALLPDPQGKRRVVFTTNIAETSLTIEGVTCVIDSGLEKVQVYDPRGGMTRLETTFISKASAEQRKGRAGRTQGGVCIRLWDKGAHQSLRDYQAEEIVSADLTSLVLELFIWGLKDYEAINWLSPPPEAHFESAKKILRSLKLVDDNNKVTPIGFKSSDFGLPPRLAAMLLQTQGPIEKGIACELSALLSERDIFSRNISRNISKNRGTDIVDRLLALQDYKKNRRDALRAYPLNGGSVEQLLLTARSFARRLRGLEKESIFSLGQLQDHVGRLLLLAYPDRLAKRRSPNDGRYLIANGKGVFLYEDDPLFGSQWLVVADADGQKREGRIYSAARVTDDILMDCVASQFVEKDEYRFDMNKQKVTGRRVIHYGAITVQSSIIAEIPPDKFQQCIHPLLQKNGFGIFNWTEECERWLVRTQWLGAHLDGFPVMSKDSLLQELSIWFLPYIANVKTIDELQSVNVFELLVSILSWEDQQLLEREAPTVYLTPSNKYIDIVYDDQQGPIVSVILQEVFGETQSPQLAGGTVPLTFQLLSPARRPIQTTSDLENFWNTSYFDVAKDMKGRYPKHRWPDKPLLEKPGKSIKRK